jgi:diguanylate cyclase (GGDEF)-like protein
VVFRLFCFLLYFCAAGPVWSAGAVLSGDTGGQDLATQVEVLEDPSRQLQLDDVSGAAFVPYQHSGSVNFGYSSSAWWLRVRLDSRRETPPDWLLEIAFPTLDDVRVFWNSGGESGQVVTGDRLPFAERPLVHRHFVVPMRITPGEPLTIYLRVVSEGTLTIPLRLWQPAALHAHDLESYAAHALYFGMLLALGLFNLLLWVRLREAVYLSYVAFVTAMAVAQLSLNGLGFQFFWPEAVLWQFTSLNSAFAATGLFGVCFTRMFLQLPLYHPRLDRVMMAFSLSFALCAVAPMLLPYQPVALTTSLVGFSFAMLAVGCGMYAMRRGNPGARFFLLAWLVLLLGVALMGLRNLAVLPTNFVTANGIQIGSAIEMLLLSFALAERIHLLRQEKEEAAAEALKVELAHVETLRQSEQVLEANVALRTRELEDANARLRENEARLTQLAQHDTLTGLANRALLFDRLEQAIRRARRKHCRFAVLLIDLDEFKPINDNWGHAVGDQLLVELARRLLACVRASDTVARLGGDEFVILLEEIDQQRSVRDLGNKILDALKQPLLLPEGAIEPSASIGVASWPEDGEEAAQLLLAADQGMYRAKRAGRGQIGMAGG